MSSQVKALCQCGLNKLISVGGGMFTFKEIQYFPYLCLDCTDVVQVNSLSTLPKCPSCNSSKVSSYKDKNLIGNISKDIVAMSFDNILYKGTYLCPKCNKMSLHFINNGILGD